MAERKKRRYLHEVDLMRVMFIGGVLLNHTTTAFENRLVDTTNSQLLLEATHLALHFTRMGFMFMTGLVLVLNYYNRDHQWLRFWKKRYISSGVPYIAWNAIIMIVATLIASGGIDWPKYWAHLGNALQYGNEYYMYYIVVTFQLYLLFPAIVYMFKKLPDHHFAIIGISAGVQLFLITGIKYWLPHIDTSNWLWWFRAYGNNVFVYQFYFVVGGFVAIHYDDVVAFIEKHHKFINWMAGLMAIGTVFLFFGDRDILQLSRKAIFSVHQPFIFIYDCFMILFVLWFGLQYAKARQHGLPDWLDNLIQAFSKVSFGIYLCQSLPIFALNAILAHISLPAWLLLLLLPVGYLFVAGGALLISWFCFKVPPFGILIGRPQWHLFSKGARSHVKSNA
ncbi:MAG: acyltransferase [Levilactobacillus sp.]|uniref:Acyltransferase n=1 Tax=Levilactobacillus suantsaiihabitans TaxID=2487722 RepID=A0A4Z0J8X4_9LACO|nr:MULTISPECIES: acyltransferase [Levilactobacillus]MCI1553545.1 acyltransferase [Levilactobacillus sp.]MCI1597934.1 acyltransferase [Levilactobacillus sp.]MCI1605982.1 acyltransferase [Levilactobacillus sp.]TGD17776.1 acyltransferase [Levilactobacillus suantsaiihabitans]